MSPPRSGSTLLFETLIVNEAIWSLDDEGHGIIEKHPELRPRQFSADSNRLTRKSYSHALARSIREDLLKGARNRDGEAIDQSASQTIRLLEKTPKNALRIPFLNAVFPEALFIYLYRDPKENISSIMDGWQSARFVTYTDKTGRNGHWSFLLPPKWEAMLNKPLEEVAAYQWETTHYYLLKDLRAIPRRRWIAVNYAEFLQDTLQVVRRLCEFMAVPMDERLLARCQNPLPLSRYTLSQPASDKWKKNSRYLAEVLPGLDKIVARINKVVSEQSWPLNDDLQIDSMPTRPRQMSPAQSVGRNQPCPCGSGKKYKMCHGRL